MWFRTLPARGPSRAGRRSAPPAASAARRVPRLRTTSQRSARSGRPDPVPQRLRADPRISSDRSGRRFGPRLVHRDRDRFELRRVVLHDHGASVLLAPRSKRLGCPGSGVKARPGPCAGMPPGVIPPGPAPESGRSSRGPCRGASATSAGAGPGTVGGDTRRPVGAGDGAVRCAGRAGGGVCFRDDAGRGAGRRGAGRARGSRRTGARAGGVPTWPTGPGGILCQEPRGSWLG